jgi:hypothetical protein
MEPPPPPGFEEQGEHPVPVLTTVGAAALACGAAAWLVAGVFRGLLPQAVALAGVVIGAGLVWLSYRFKKEFVQYLVVPAAVVAGLVVIAPSATGGGQNAFDLIAEALKQGGLGQPPVPFDPGWRFLLMAVFVLVSAATAGMAVATNRPKIGLLIPVPLAGAAALVQPEATAVTSSIVAAVFLAGGLALAQGAEMARHGEFGAGFETRRLLRGTAMVLVLVVGLVALSRAGFLFPEPERQQVIPPQRPKIPPPTPDRPLFYVKTTLKLPYRLGVIDVYSYDRNTKQGAWLLPPYDPRALQKLHSPARLDKLPFYPKDANTTLTLDVRAQDIGGHQLPDIAGLERLDGLSSDVDYDPRAQTLRVSGDRIAKGFSYRMTAEGIPSAAQLEKADAPPKSLNEFISAPPPPPEVAKLLQDAPSNLYDRVYYVRKALYDKVVAAGPGTPIDVAPSRVPAMLAGGDATPYEISAAEALLARWAGAPARIGYGYYAGTPQKDGTVEIRPRHGATWLEVYFQGFGWVPIIGNPPQAKPSNSSAGKSDQVTRASKNFNLIVYVPTKETTLLQYYDYARYYFVVALPFVVALALAVMFYPALLKVVRRQRRRSWARERGVRARVAVAYAELRDTCRDLSIGDPASTPLEFLRFLEEDAEHRELAWLVTRTLWADLDRDLREEDAEAAERLAASLTKRLLGAQSALNRTLALVARTSLAEPYTDEIPNLWWHSPVAGLGRRLRSRLLPRRRGSRLARLRTT